mgnify:CR=1 FL=1
MRRSSASPLCVACGLTMPIAVVKTSCRLKSWKRGASSSAQLQRAVAAVRLLASVRTAIDAAIGEGITVEAEGEETLEEEGGEEDEEGSSFLEVRTVEGKSGGRKP